MTTTPSHTSDPRFTWTNFYMEFSDKLLSYKDNRTPLVEKVREVCSRYGRYYLDNDEYPDGTFGPYRDICPFTVMASFNYRTADYTRGYYGIRYRIANELAEFLGVRTPTPDFSDCREIPLIGDRFAVLFKFARDRSDQDIDYLWRLFADAINLADYGDAKSRESFMTSYNQAMHTGWQVEEFWQVRILTLGLSWIRPWEYSSLHGSYERDVAIRLGLLSDHDTPIDNGKYLDIIDFFKCIFDADTSSVHSFPEYALALYEAINEPEDAFDPIGSLLASLSDMTQKYSIRDIVDEGCFVEESKLEAVIIQLKHKKNLILQGPPGTGKTWLAKKLAYALIEHKDDSRVRSFQFHPNISYEDFIRGYRPTEDGRLMLVDGPFLKIVEDAANDPQNDYVMVIEEINRGNPAQIFGEMLTLLESNKRDPSEALTLAHPKSDDERVHIPSNVYVIGTMNLADRSIALVDFALRRRFAFVDIDPVFDARWRLFVNREYNLSIGFLADIGSWMTALNESISSDRRLGPNFQIGHSVMIPTSSTSHENQIQWFRDVVEFEIGPLLYEYWFNEPEKAEREKRQLLRGLEE